MYAPLSLGLAILALSASRIPPPPDAPPPAVALTAKQREQLRERDRWAAELQKQRDAAKWDAASLICRKILTIEKTVYGDVHDEIADTWEVLAEIHEAKDDFATARVAREKVLAIREKLHGAQHWQTKDAHLELARLPRRAAAGKEQRKALANLRQLRQQVDAASGSITEPKVTDYSTAIERALQTVRAVYGETDPDYGYWLAAQGLLRAGSGDFARAESLLRQGLDIQVQALGELHPAHEGTRRILGMLYQSIGDYGRAEATKRRCAELHILLWGGQTLGSARALNDVGLTCMDMGDLVEANRLFRAALRNFERAGRGRDADYVIMLGNLALAHLKMSEYDEAKRLYQRIGDLCAGSPRGQAIMQNMQVPKHLFDLYLREGDIDRAKALLPPEPERDKQNRVKESPLLMENRAALYVTKGDSYRAEPLLREVVELGGGNDPIPGRTRELLARCYYAEGRMREVEHCLRLALSQMAEHAERTFVVQSEGQQLRLLRPRRERLDLYLSLAPRLDANGDKAYQEMLSWKTMLYARRHLTAKARQNLHKDAESNRLYTEMTKLAGELVPFALQPPEPSRYERWEAEVRYQTREKDKLEIALGQRIADYRRQRTLAQRTPADIQAALPAEAVLLDLMEYTRFRPPPSAGKPLTTERCVTAFVVRRGRPTVQVDLGPAQAIARAIDAWRGQAGGEAKADREDAETALRRLLGQPLQQHLAGAKLVLVCPDGCTARLPWAALPGQTPGSYLIEQAAVAVVPVPALLPDLLVSAARTGGPSLLLVGDARFDAPPGKPADSARRRSAQRGATRGKLPLPPHAREELRALHEWFKDGNHAVLVKLLNGEQATEEALRQQAPHFRYLHFADPVYFTPPPEKGNDRPGPLLYPGLFSGLVLDGVNRPAELGQDDGILTAAEIVRLNLNGVELVALSDCDIGSASSADGQGVLALQRAFQVAGAGSVLATLRKVDEQPRRTLLTEFYQNLWTKRLPKAEALRQAQLHALADERKARGAAERQGRRTTPGSWSAFVLSGDWR